MKIDSNFNQPKLGSVTEPLKKYNNYNNGQSAESLADSGIKVEISKKGFALAGEMEPFIDTYETTYTLLKGTGHIGSKEMMNGDFTDILADNYQNELQRLRENYSGKELDKQLSILDKAYEEAAASISRGYTKQLKMLTGDIVIKPQNGILYTSEAAAEKAYQEELNKSEKRKKVIDSSMSGIIQSDVRDILLQLKNPALNHEDKKNNIMGSFMSYRDIKNLASCLRSNANEKLDGFTDFSKSILERYAVVNTEQD